MTMEDHGNTVFCCAFSHDIVEGPDGKAVDLATASYDGTTRVWDLAKCAGNHSKKCRRILKGNPGGVWCCAYTHDSRFLVTGCSKGSICVYSAPQRYDLVGRQDSSHGPNAVFACSTGAQVRVCMSVCMCPPAHSCLCRHAKRAVLPDWRMPATGVIVACMRAPRYASLVPDPHSIRSCRRGVLSG